jgi:flavin-dependent dehydrogenase
VVVNGGGPAGLINAVTAYTAGAAVVVLEQRAAVPTRSVWFDLTSSAHILRRWQIFSPAQDLLAAFGWVTDSARPVGVPGVCARVP